MRMFHDIPNSLTSKRPSLWLVCWLKRVPLNGGKFCAHLGPWSDLTCWRNLHAHPDHVTCEVVLDPRNTVQFFLPLAWAGWHIWKHMFYVQGCPWHHVWPLGCKVEFWGFFCWALKSQFEGVQIFLNSQAFGAYSFSAYKIQCWNLVCLFKPLSSLCSKFFVFFFVWKI